MFFFHGSFEPIGEKTNKAAKTRKKRFRTRGAIRNRWFNKALLMKAYWPLVSLNTALLDPYYPFDKNF